MKQGIGIPCWTPVLITCRQESWGRGGGKKGEKRMCEHVHHSSLSLCAISHDIKSKSEQTQWYIHDLTQKGWSKIIASEPASYQANKNAGVYFACNQMTTETRMLFFTNHQHIPRTRTQWGIFRTSNQAHNHHPNIRNQHVASDRHVDNHYFSCTPDLVTCME